MKIIASKPFKVKLTSRTGTARTRWQVKLWTRDPHTEKRILVAQRTFESKATATDATRELIAKYEQTGGQIIVGEKMTFADLADHAKSTIYKPAVILAGRKTDGVKRYKSVHGQLDILARYFGPMRIGNISANDLKSYKKWRFELGSLRGKVEGVPVGLTVINRELAVMRRLMKYAFGSGWITRDIFIGSKAIDAGAERQRSRILADSEETRLLENARSHPHKGRKKDRHENPYLTAIIMLALDSAMRKTEILKLRWQDVELDGGEVKIISEHTKTQTERTVPLSDRVIAELQTLPTYGVPGRIFPIGDFKGFWETTKKLAGLEDIRFHDLRRTAITRMQMREVPLGIAAKIAGHARLETTARIYTATDASIVQSVREKINAANRDRLEALDAANDAGFVN